MLVLSRKVGESITIGKDIRIIILNVHGAQIKVGIDAPEDVLVMRAEVPLKEEKGNAK